MATFSGLRRLEVVDSHTAGEPTRVVVTGGPDLAGLTPAQAVERLRREHDWLRTAAVLEPRGSDILVGALLLPPTRFDTAAGVVFFNNVGYLGMCGHGMIGVGVTLAYLGRIPAGEHRIETPAGDVTLRLAPSERRHTSFLHVDSRVSIRNVASRRYRARVPVEVPGHGRITGDIAWGGNWFFLCSDHGLELRFERVEQLTDFSRRLRAALAAGGITGEAGAEIDHIELIGPPASPENHGRNFVLCPGLAYDRSPCGTGTSAKLACLAADGVLEPGVAWRQEGILGSVFEGSYERGESGDEILPTLAGRAYITARSELLLDPSDPFRWGIGTHGPD